MWWGFHPRLQSVGGRNQTAVVTIFSCWIRELYLSFSHRIIFVIWSALSFSFFIIIIHRLNPWLQFGHFVGLSWYGVVDFWSARRESVALLPCRYPRTFRPDVSEVVLTSFQKFLRTLKIPWIAHRHELWYMMSLKTAFWLNWTCIHGMTWHFLHIDSHGKNKEWKESCKTKLVPPSARGAKFAVSQSAADVCELWS